MERNDVFAQLPDAILPWYQANKRDLPWRTDRNPYHIWVSEIMLQQTRVEAVKGYYARFLDKFPTVADLANADDEILHKMWEGLGYYSRVRNLKKAAQVIMEKHGGVFPGEYSAVLALPGIGVYTAGAICSIAFEQPTPAVDGNVLRVASRLLNDNTPIDTPAFKTAVGQALAECYPERAGDFTQALMELGATICGPNRKPDCENCPCKAFCQAYQSGTAEDVPVKIPKKGRRIEEKTVFIFSCDGSYALEKRPSKGLLAGLWQFPNVPGNLSTEGAIRAVEEMGLKIKEILRKVERKHIFTHIEWHMCGIYLELVEKNNAYTWLEAQQVRAEAALPTAFRQFFEEVENV
ncbi:MAG: A/G-specific adenine glycosylase [Oscillospiraceae bacterium]|nr:A/G-specific adenine glycosylase [Oscillospiraceae bacterium]